MTGGQPVDGPLSVRKSRANSARRRRRIVVLAEDPDHISADRRIFLPA